MRWTSRLKASSKSDLMTFTTTLVPSLSTTVDLAKCSLLQTASCQGARNGRGIHRAQSGRGGAASLPQEWWQPGCRGCWSSMHRSGSNRIGRRAKIWPSLTASNPIDWMASMSTGFSRRLTKESEKRAELHANHRLPVVEFNRAEFVAVDEVAPEVVLIAAAFGCALNDDVGFFGESSWKERPR